MNTATRLILRHENELPPDVRALLHGPAPDTVWHLPSHPRIGNPFRVAATVSLVVLIPTLILFLMTAYESVNAARFRSEGILITGSMLLFAAGLYWLCWRAKKKAERLEADLGAGRVRFGLWLTAQHVLVHDSEGICCARRSDIAATHIYRAGGGRPHLLVVTLTNQQKIYVIVNSLDGWAGQAEKLRDTFAARLMMNPDIRIEHVQQIADRCLPAKNFSEFVRWLNEEVQRVRPSPQETAALLAAADAALASWPDSARSPNNEAFMFVESNGVWEYGVNSNGGSDTLYRGFKKGDASWLLPLCRAAYFFEAENIFPTVASVRDCAATFQDVPLTEIHFTGGMEPVVFDAFLAWVATKPVQVLEARDYRPEPNTLSNLRDGLKTQLVAFKQQHGLK